MRQPEFRHTFTRYHFPDVGCAVSLLTLRQKLGEAEVVWEEQGGSDPQQVHYGWWLANEEIKGSPRKDQNISDLIPEIGGTIELVAPPFWWGPDLYYFRLFRKNYSTFVVVDGGF